MPGKLEKYFEFLRDYKIPDGKPANQFAFNGKLLNKVYYFDTMSCMYIYSAIGVRFARY